MKDAIDSLNGRVEASFHRQICFHYPKPPFRSLELVQKPNLAIIPCLPREKNIFQNTNERFASFFLRVNFEKDQLDCWFLSLPGSLTVVRTVCPFSSRDFTRYAAMNPVPPVTQYSGIFSPSLSQRRAHRDRKQSKRT